MIVLCIVFLVRKSLPVLLTLPSGHGTLFSDCEDFWEHFLMYRSFSTGLEFNKSSKV